MANRKPKTQTVTITIKVDPEMRAMLKALAENDCRTVSGYVKYFIKSEYEKLGKA